MTQRGGRITCPRCGANNFDTVTACWKCGTALAGGINPAPLAAPAMSAPRPEIGGYVPPSISSPVGASGDPAVARRAAFWLAVVFPWFGLPIGWAFMMVEDHRRQAIGRYCAIWSIIALIFHFLFMFASMQLLVSRALPILMSLTGGNQRNVSGGLGDDLGGMNGGMPRLQ